MNYLALYRKYRPVKFSEVIGQEHITETFKNIIKSERIGHAYLLTGTRGVGKTSLAKIFARAVNCLSPLEDGSPCGACAICALGENLDIIEIDAASNNGVDEIRELREKVKFHPVNSKYKVYIIDEVHMLSAGAFNALLKTLEEPPPSTIFILATTESYKLPPTILSRCMRFDFRLISLEDLAKLIERIFAENGQKADKDAIQLIASAGQGSARDALSIADMCCGYAPDRITYNDVLTVTGASDPEISINLAEEILRGDTGAVLKRLNELFDLGKGAGVLAKDLISVFRDISIVGMVESPDKFFVLPKNMTEKIKMLSKAYPISICTVCIDILSGIEQDLRYGLSPKIILESALLKCCFALKSSDNSMIITRIEKLENAFKDIEMIKERLR